MPLRVLMPLDEFVFIIYTEKNCAFVIVKYFNINFDPKNLSKYYTVQVDDNGPWKQAYIFAVNGMYTIFYIPLLK